jgi:arylsulfatase A-like enzyme
LLSDRAESQTRPAPNVLIVVTDDQRATNTLWVMPETQRYFRRGGISFTNAYAVTPLCCPSRATILTGRYAHNTGVRTNADADRLDLTTLFPRLLRDARYKTAIIGKFLNGWPLSRRPPHFDRWALGGNPYVDPRFNIDGSVGTAQGYSTTLMGTYAARFLRAFEANDDSPWLLYVAPKAPHHPWTPARRYRDHPLPAWQGNPAVFERDRSDKPPFVRKFDFTVSGGRKVRDGQLRALLTVDDMVGRIFTVLRELGEARNTLAIFTSDNGYTWAEHGLGGDRGAAGQKRVPYTESIRVPLLLRWPDYITPGATDGRLAGTVDVAPTVLAATGVAPDPAKPPLDGRSLLALERRNRILLEYWFETRIPTWASLRSRTFQYTEYYASDAVMRTFREYYDLVRDPWMLRNLLHDGNPDNDPDVRALAGRLARDRACSSTSGRRACP